MTDNALCLDITHRAGAVVVKVAGDVDLETSSQLGETLRRVGTGRNVVLDCTKVGFLDSAGLGVLVAESTHRSRAGDSPRVRPSAPVRRVLQISGVGWLIEPGS